jgi:hypothetical protein
LRGPAASGARRGTSCPQVDPAPHRATGTWAEFLRSQAEAILAMDFIETVTLTDTHPELQRRLFEPHRVVVVAFAARRFVEEPGRRAMQQSWGWLERTCRFSRHVKASDTDRTLFAVKQLDRVAR